MTASPFSNGLVGRVARFLACIVPVATIGVGMPGAASAVECHVNRSQPRSVTFFSDAPIEDFEGVTNAIDGYIIWKGDSLTPDHSYEESELYFEVSLDELDTGIGLRNRHMRDHYLHTAEHPHARYAGKIDSVTATTDTTWQVFTSGTFTIHGVDQVRELRCEVVRLDAAYYVKSDFSVNLKDHDIEVPSLMFMKISEEILLSLEFRMVEVE